MPEQKYSLAAEEICYKMLTFSTFRQSANRVTILLVGELVVNTSRVNFTNLPHDIESDSWSAWETSSAQLQHIGETASGNWVGSLHLATSDGAMQLRDMFASILETSFEYPQNS